MAVSSIQTSAGGNRTGTAGTASTSSKKTGSPQWSVSGRFGKGASDTPAASPFEQYAKAFGLNRFTVGTSGAVTLPKDGARVYQRAAALYDLYINVTFPGGERTDGIAQKAGANTFLRQYKNPFVIDSFKSMAITQVTYEPVQPAAVVQEIAAEETAAGEVETTAPTPRTIARANQAIIRGNVSLMLQRGTQTFRDAAPSVTGKKNDLLANNAKKTSLVNTDLLRSSRSSSNTTLSAFYKGDRNGNSGVLKSALDSYLQSDNNGNGLLSNKPRKSPLSLIGGSKKTSVTGDVLEDFYTSNKNEWTSSLKSGLETYRNPGKTKNDLLKIDLGESSSERGGSQIYWSATRTPLDDFYGRKST